MTEYYYFVLEHHTDPLFYFSPVSSFSIAEIVSATSKAILSEDEIFIKLYVNTLSEVPIDTFSVSAADGATVQAKK
jgi:hypothetical protein